MENGDDGSADDEQEHEENGGQGAGLFYGTCGAGGFQEGVGDLLFRVFGAGEDVFDIRAGGLGGDDFLEAGGAIHDGATLGGVAHHVLATDGAGKFKLVHEGAFDCQNISHPARDGNADFVLKVRRLDRGWTG